MNVQPADWLTDRLLSLFTSSSHFSFFFVFPWPQIQQPSQTRLNFSTLTVSFFFFFFLKLTTVELQARFGRLLFFHYKRFLSGPLQKKTWLVIKPAYQSKGTKKKPQLVLLVFTLPRPTRRLSRALRRSPVQFGASLDSHYGNWKRWRAGDPDAMNKTWCCCRVAWHETTDRVFPWCLQRRCGAPWFSLEVNWSFLIRIPVGCNDSRIHWPKWKQVKQL